MNWRSGFRRLAVVLAIPVGALTALAVTMDRMTENRNLVYGELRAAEQALEDATAKYDSAQATLVSAAKAHGLSTSEVDPESWQAEAVQAAAAVLTDTKSRHARAQKAYAQKDQLGFVDVINSLFVGVGGFALAFAVLDGIAALFSWILRGFRQGSTEVKS